MAILSIRHAILARKLAFTERVLVLIQVPVLAAGRDSQCKLIHKPVNTHIRSL